MFIDLNEIWERIAHHLILFYVKCNRFRCRLSGNGNKLLFKYLKKYDILYLKKGVTD